MEGAVKCEHLGALGQRGALCTLSGEPRETGAAAEKQVRRVLEEAALVGEGGEGLAVPATSWRGVWKSQTRAIGTHCPWPQVLGKQKFPRSSNVTALLMW